MGRRDRQISEAVWEFARRLREIHPEAKAVIQDFKWEEEDVYIEVKMPPMTKEEEAKYDEEEGDIYEKVSRLTNDIFDELTNDIFDEKDVFILALVHPDKAEV